MLFCPCVVRKATENIDKKALNIFHQAQKGFCGIFVIIPQHQKGYLVYVTSSRKIISSYDVVFDESFSSALAYTSKPYSKAMAMRPSVTYTTCATSSREQTGNIITFAQFEEGNLLSFTSNDVESGDKSDDNSIMPPLLIKEEMDMCLSVTYTPFATSSREQTGNIITFTQFEEGNILTKTCNNAESGDKYNENSIMAPLLSEEERDAMDLAMSQIMILYLRKC